MTDNMDEFDNDQFDAAEATGRNDGATNAKQSLVEKWRSNPLFKLLVIMGIVGVALAGALGAFSGGAVKETSRITKAPEIKEAPGGAASPFFIEQNKQANEERVGQALVEGGSAMPTPTGNDIGDLLNKNKKDPLLEFQAETERLKQEFLAEQQARNKQIQSMQQQIQTQKQTPEDDSLAKAMQKQMQQLMESWVPHGGKFIAGTAPAENTTKTSAQEASLNKAQAANAARAAQQKAVKPLVSSGTVNYVQLLTEANSDIPGPILAQILSGPLAGGRAIGRFQVMNEYLVMNFTQVSLKGKEYTINALALDPDTTLGGLATEVDHRYFVRVILPAAGSFISAFGSALGESNTTTTVSDGTVVQDKAKKSLEEGIYSGVGQMGQTISQFFQNEANQTKTLVRVAVGTPMGLFFLQPVLKDQSQNQSQNDGASQLSLDNNQAQNADPVPYDMSGGSAQPRTGANDANGGAVNLTPAQRAILNSINQAQAAK